MAVLFAVVAGLALAGGVGVIASRRPVHSALSLLLVLGSLAVEYLLLDAQFIAALQVIIYAGAIVVLFVFIIMLLHARSGEEPRLRPVLPTAWGIPLCTAVGLVLLFVVAGAGRPPAATGEEFGTVQDVGRALFSRFLLPFEAASVVLLIGMIGAVALGKRLPAAATGAPPSGSGEGGR
ncbi:MAG TPA: NADH-quinone oxidoreductase subunit J [bacterium]|nr:NADH-quinone oxidoreductase subunit J [bacterium]